MGNSTPICISDTDPAAPAATSNAYRRVGDKIEKTVIGFDIDGKPREEVITLTRESIEILHGKNFVSQIPYYDKHVIVPSHTNYKQVIGTCWNIYNPIINEPRQGPHPTWDTLMQRVFGEQIDLGWDYLTLAYRQPTQMLPVLCLVSQENHTGKSSFGNAIAYLFGLNVGFFTQDDLSSSFNVWIKHLVAVFEEISETKTTLNKIKAMATARSATLNAKYRAQVEFQPFVKIIILSNNDRTFIKANENDIRYWVRQLKPIPSKEFIPDFDERLKAEAPAVLHTLRTHEITVPKQSRMWFDPSLLTTEALTLVRAESKPEIVKDLEILIDELIGDKGSFYATPSNFNELLHYRYSVSGISSALRNDMGLTPERQMRFTDVKGASRNTTPYLFCRPGSVVVPPSPPPSTDADDEPF